MHSLDVALIVLCVQIQRPAMNVLLDSLCLLENVYPAAMVAILVTQHKLAHHVHLGILWMPQPVFVINVPLEKCLREALAFPAMEIVQLVQARSPLTHIVQIAAQRRIASHLTVEPTPTALVIVQLGTLQVHSLPAQHQAQQTYKAGLLMLTHHGLI